MTNVNDRQAETVKKQMEKIRLAGGQVVEAPTLMDNAEFGPCVYFTVRYGDSYVEYGVKQDGSSFVVH